MKIIVGWDREANEVAKININYDDPLKEWLKLKKESELYVSPSDINPYPVCFTERMSYFLVEANDINDALDKVKKFYNK